MSLCSPELSAARRSALECRMAAKNRVILQQDFNQSYIMRRATAVPALLAS